VLVAHVVFDTVKERGVAQPRMRPEDLIMLLDVVDELLDYKKKK
jgi:hypothetical protein